MTGGGTVRGAAAEAAVALFLGLVLVTVGAALTETGPTQPDLRPSTYRNEPTGLRALHEVLIACGAQPERLLEDPSTLASAGHGTDRTLVVAAPSEPLLDSEIEAVFDWVEQGGRLVVTAAMEIPPLRRSFHEALIEPLGIRARVRRRPARANAVMPDAGIDPASTLAWRPRLVIEEITVNDPSSYPRDARAGEATPIIRTRSHTLVAAVPFGDAGGEVVVIADETLLDNRTLREADNAVAVVQLLTLRPGDEGRVLFDEFHHGFRLDGERAELSTQALNLLIGTWPGRGVLVIALAWLVFLIGRSVRLGRPLPSAPPPRRKLSEHADALGRLLESARARAEALRVLAAGARRVVGPRAGLSPTLAARPFAERLAASPSPGAEELAAALIEADTIRPERDADLARVAGELAAARRRYLHGGI